ncbi:MAG: hypothetical protein HFF15_02330, partial [Angelakisella sp.]|nr:hypothetical protein [Angelakisella sp.]
TFRPKSRERYAGGTLRRKKMCCPYLTSVMSGSPIIQDGKLVGSVTHVFVRDPTRGFGIFAENIQNNAKSVLFSLKNVS